MSVRDTQGLEPRSQQFTDRELAETELAARNQHLRNMEFVPLDEVARRVPAYTPQERDALQALVGTLIYSINDKALQVFDGAVWQTLAFVGKPEEPPPETATAKAKR